MKHFIIKLFILSEWPSTKWLPDWFQWRSGNRPDHHGVPEERGGGVM